MTQATLPDKHRYCVIMCGGIGSRFWPASRQARPKQFLDFFGIGRSLLQMTYDRLQGLVRSENIIVVTNAMYAPLVREQLPDLLPSNILLEPARRNTAPCIAWASCHINALDPEAQIIVCPSDHLITREKEWHDAIDEGFAFVAAHDALLTLGINPTRPETGYGYIQIGKHECGNINKVKTFTEKPNLELAKVFLSTGEFFWNSGIFMWSAKAILAALHKAQPEMMAGFATGADAFGTPREKEFVDSFFPSCQSISIDYAVLEKAENVYVEKVFFGWNDLGTWSALYDNSPKNTDRNVTQGCHVMAYNATGNIFAVPSDKVVVVDGLQDYIIADAGDVLLICPKEREQSIKQMVNDIKMDFGEKYL